jgi:NAD(P)H-dependent flavin oxidoreductase YrpB (nitropropane dioxygenase family)
MGADGIMMGTRFMATKECVVAERHKQNMIKMAPDNLYLKHRCLNTPDPRRYEELMKIREQGMSMNEWIPKATALFLKEDKWKAAAYRGTEDSGEELETMSTLWSEAVASIDDIPTCKELINRIVSEAERILDGFDFLKSWLESKKQSVK